MEEAKWYVVHTYSGYENAVKTAIENGGAYGLGLIYAKSMFNASEGH